MTVVSLPNVQSLNAEHTGGMPVLLALITAICDSRACLGHRRPLYVSLMGSSREKVVRKHV